MISSSAVNSDFSDVASTLTGSVASNGVTTITGQLKSSVNSTPAYSASFDLTTGFGSSTAGEADIWAGGSIQVEVTATSVTINQSATINGNLTLTGALIAGSIAFTGTGAIQIPAGTTAQRPVFAGNIVSNGTGGANGSYANAVLTGGSGTGATANLIVSGGAVTSVTLTGGVGYIVGDLLSTSSVGGLTGFSYEVTQANVKQGDIRYNTTLGYFEGYDGTEWQVMSTVTTAYTLQATAAAGLLTVNVLNAKTGAAPTAVDPLGIIFRDATLTNGDQVTAVVTSALSINTNGIGATLGTSNNVPFRFWIVAFYNGGTPCLGLINCSVPGTIYPLVDANLQSSVAISNAATSAGVYYSPNGITALNSPIKILGYLEYSGGLATAGNYSAGPTALQQFVAGVPKPGTVIQEVYTASTSGGSTSSGTPSATYNVNITPTSAINQIEVDATILSASASGSGTSNANSQIYRNNAIPLWGALQVGSGNSIVLVEGSNTFMLLDSPQTVASTNYAIFFWRTGTNVAAVSFGGGTVRLKEIMG